jgi:hypothetical protein
MFKTTVQPPLVSLFSSVGSQERARELREVGARIKKVHDICATEADTNTVVGRNDTEEEDVRVQDTIIVATSAPLGRGRGFAMCRRPRDMRYSSFSCFASDVVRGSNSFTVRSLRGPSCASPVFASLVLSLED